MHSGISPSFSNRAAQFIEAHIVPALTAVRLPGPQIPDSWLHLNGLRLVDPNIAGSQLIIGTKLYVYFLHNRVSRGSWNKHVAQRNILELIVSEQFNADDSSSNITVHTTMLERLDCNLQQFWQIKDLLAKQFLKNRSVRISFIVLLLM